MRIAIASGKGGTGKTTLATSLASVLSRAGKDVVYLDCDVEEPNGRILLRPNIDTVSDMCVPVPEVVESRCTHCGDCAESCEFNALTVLPDKVLVFRELCHSCGACSLVCPEKAIEEVPHPIGEISTGRGFGARFVEGRLNIGEPQSPPLIKAVKQKSSTAEVVIIDAPPGTSCPVIESISGAQFVVLVTEPTPFGLHDLKLAVSMLRQLMIPCGVVINRDEGDSGLIIDFCASEGVEILTRIPFDRKIAEAYSRGELLSESCPEYARRLLMLFDTIVGQVAA